MKNEERERARQLREALEGAERSGAGRPYPQSLQQAAADYHRAREHEGASLRQVAAELGVSEASLMRWSRHRKKPEPLLRAIEVMAEPAERTSAVVVYGPRGLRVEGLTVDELARLIGRLS